MAILNILYSYIHYLIHPFKTHESFLSPDTFVGYKPERLSVYESLGASWLFIVVNGLFRIIVLNFVLISFYQMFLEDSSLFAELIDINEYSGFYLLILSTILDSIFYPLFGFFIIQFWEVIIKLFARMLEVPGDLTQKVHDILAVNMSSNILKVIPIFGGPAQGLASLVLMYAGLRKQLNASPILCFCIIFTPMLLILGVISFLTVLAMTFSLI